MRLCFLFRLRSRPHSPNHLSVNLSKVVPRFHWEHFQQQLSFSLSLVLSHASIYSIVWNEHFFNTQEWFCHPFVDDDIVWPVSYHSAYFYSCFVYYVSLSRDWSWAEMLHSQLIWYTLVSLPVSFKILLLCLGLRKIIRQLRTSVSMTVFRVKQWPVWLNQRGIHWVILMQLANSREFLHTTCQIEAKWKCCKF